MNRTAVARLIPALGILLVCLAALLAPLPHLPAGPAVAAPAALDAPTNIACRPVGNALNQVRVSWKDESEGAADFVVQRKEVGANSWSDLDDVAQSACDGDGNCAYEDSAAGTNTVYHYRIIADDGNEQSAPSAVCREPLAITSDLGNYRAFYRLEECPPITEDGSEKQVCTQDVDNADGENQHAADLIDTHEQHRTFFMDLGFNDPANTSGGKPFPIDLFPCNNGCANSNGIQIPPDNMEGTNYNPATGSGESYEIFVVGHEEFHKIQGSHGGGGADPYYKWLIEGQARASEDSTCIFDTQAACDLWENTDTTYYAGAARAYLALPGQNLLEASYTAAIFWKYVAERFSSSTDEPTRDLDWFLEYWEQNELNQAANQEKDGIGTIDDTLAGTATFEEVFRDFAVANYAKDLFSDPVPAGFEKYNYVDEESYNGLYSGTYGSVKLTVSDDLGLDDSISGVATLRAWGARYFEVRPDPSIPVVALTVAALPETNHQLNFHVLAIEGGAIVEEWTDSGTSFSLGAPNISPAYDKIVLIVTSEDHDVNFQYGFNLEEGLNIISPTSEQPAAAGEATQPKKILLKLRVIGADLAPLSGLTADDFTIAIGGVAVHPPANAGDDAIITFSFIQDQYWIVLRAPGGVACAECDLEVAYGEFDDLEPDAVLYGPAPDVDNVVIVDRSGSMEGTKLAAAKDAGQVYVDSYSEGDRIGVVSFNEAPSLDLDLQPWDDDSRDAAHEAIEDLEAGGDTANGAALREGMAQLSGQDSPNPAWAMVLLSDGEDTVEDTGDHIPQFVKEYKSAKEDGEQVPVIHVVAVGNDADGVALEQVSNVSGGEFNWLPDAPTMQAAAAPDAVASLETEYAADLSEIYRVVAESVTGEQQIYTGRSTIHPTAITRSTPPTHTVQVDGGASEAIFVVKYFPSDAQTAPDYGVRRPGGANVAPTLTGPGHTIYRVPAPEAGKWVVETFGCRPPGSAGPDEPVTAAEPPFCALTYLVEVSLLSDLTIEGFLGLPVEERKTGTPMPLYVLLSDVAGIPGAVVTAEVEKTGETLTLLDDGAHGDGAAGDGFYGGVIANTNSPGGYSVRVRATGTSSFGDAFERRLRLSFYMARDPDRDRDRLPDPWELEHGTDPTRPDADADPDRDGLTNGREFGLGTHPLDPDTDDGGENDGSEVNRGANPLHPRDDGARPPRAKAWALVGRVSLRLSTSGGARLFDVYRAPGPDGPWRLVGNDLPVATEWVDGGLPNGVPVCYQVRARSGQAISAPSEITCATPNTDPHPPHGIVEINDGAARSASRRVQLSLLAWDDPEQEEHPPFDGELLDPRAVESGVAEMMISNSGDFAGAVWEPYRPSRAWTVVPLDGGATVFVRFRDVAGNVSEVVVDSIRVISGAGTATPTATSAPGTPTATPTATSAPGTPTATGTVPSATPTGSTTPEATPTGTKGPSGQLYLPLLRR